MSLPKYLKPKRLKIGPDQVALVQEAPLPKGHYAVTLFDRHGVGIVLSSRTSKPLRHLSLLHEMIHVAEEKMQQGGVIKRRSRERYVGELATILFGMLSRNGLWRGVSKAEADRYFEEHVEVFDRERRRGNRARAALRHSRAWRTGLRP